MSEPKPRNDEEILAEMEKTIRGTENVKSENSPEPQQENREYYTKDEVKKLFDHLSAENESLRNSIKNPSGKGVITDDNPTPKDEWKKLFHAAGYTNI